MGTAFSEAVQGVKPAQAAWLRHWLHLLDLEEGATASSQPDIWHMPGFLPSPSLPLLLTPGRIPNPKSRT